MVIFGDHEAHQCGIECTEFNINVLHGWQKLPWSTLYH